jgi:hypothetical protein
MKIRAIGILSLGLCLILLTLLTTLNTGCGNSSPSSPAATATFTPTITSTPSPTVCANIGFNTVGSTSTGEINTAIFASYFTVGSPVTVSSLSVSIGTTGVGNTVLGIYADNAGTPTSLLASGIINNTVSSLNTVSVTPVVLAAGNYWLAIDPSSGSTLYEQSGGAFVTYIQSSYTYNGSLPSTMPAVSYSGSGDALYLYATYCN